MRTVVVGNGVVALTAALRLARDLPGEGVTVVGPSARPGAATLAAAAMLNSFAEVEAGGLSHELDRLRFDLSREATALWPAFVDELAAIVGAPRCEACHGRCKGHLDTGSYVVANAAAPGLDDANFDAILDAMHRCGEPHALVSPDEIPDYAPTPRLRATRAVYLPREGWLNPRLLLEGLDAALASLPNVRRVDAAATRLAHENGRVTAVACDDGTRVEGRDFLLAPGARAWDLLRASGLELPIQRVFYGVGVSLELEQRGRAHTRCIRTPHRGLALGVYTAPYLAGPAHPHDRVLVGATHVVSPAPHEHGRDARASELLRTAVEQVNARFADARVVRVNVGWRPVSEDTYPLVGRTSVPNLVVATGTRRDGLHMAPLLARVLSGLLRGEAIDPRWQAFRPERPPIRTLTRDQAIAKALSQLEAAREDLSADARRALRDDLVRTHDLAGADTWGIPPEMLDMYRYGHARA